MFLEYAATAASESRIQAELDDVIHRVIDSAVDELIQVSELEIVAAAQAIAGGKQQTALIEQLAVDRFVMLDVEEVCDKSLLVTAHSPFLHRERAVAARSRHAQLLQT